MGMLVWEEPPSTSRVLMLIEKGSARACCTNLPPSICKLPGDARVKFPAL